MSVLPLFGLCYVFVWSLFDYCQNATKTSQRVAQGQKKRRPDSIVGPPLIWKFKKSLFLLTERYRG